MEAAKALADLVEISSQIESAVLADGDGGVLGSTFAAEERAQAVAREARELRVRHGGGQLRACERIRRAIGKSRAASSLPSANVTIEPSAK